MDNRHIFISLHLLPRRKASLLLKTIYTCRTHSGRLPLTKNSILNFILCPDLAMRVTLASETRYKDVLRSSYVGRDTQSNSSLPLQYVKIYTGADRWLCGWLNTYYNHTHNGGWHDDFSACVYVFW